MRKAGNEGAGEQVSEEIAVTDFTKERKGRPDVIKPVKSNEMFAIMVR